MLSTRWSGIIGGAGRGASIGSAFGPAGSLIGGLGGGLLGGLGGDDEEDLIDTLMDAQIKEINRAEAERTRAREIEMGQTIGAARAAIGASNIQFSGTSKAYTEMLASDYMRQAAWDRQKTNVERYMAKLGASLQQDSIRSAGMQFALEGVGAAVDAFGIGGISQARPFGPGDLRTSTVLPASAFPKSLS